MKIGRNEPCPCGSGKKYKKCCFGKERIMELKSGEELPLYKTIVSDSEGSKIIFVSRKKPNNNFEFISVLVDEWKMGLKDCYGSFNATKSDILNIINKTSFINSDINKCKKLVKRGLIIAKEVGTMVPKEFEKFRGIIGNLDDIKISGSIYKCFKCGEGDLNDEIVEIIKEVTRRDMKKGVCGTPDEQMIFFACDKCKDEE